MQRTVAIGGVLGAVGVAAGALGAHALRDRLGPAAEVWHTAVLYNLVHAVALVALTRSEGGRSAAIVAALWAVGVVLFSGSLYALALGGPPVLGPVTPVGGVCLIAGWLVLAVTALRS